MPEPSKDLPGLTHDPHARKLLLIIGYMLIIAGAAFALTALWPAIRVLFKILSPFVVAFVVAYLFNPIVNFIQRRLRMSRVMGVLFVNFLIFLILGIFIGIVMPILYKQIGNAYTEVREFVTREVLPKVAEEFDLTLQPVEPTHGEMLEYVQNWKEEQLRRAETDEQRLHLDKLQGTVQGWIESEDDEEEETAADVRQLQVLVVDWAGAYPRTGDTETINERLALLTNYIQEWTQKRTSWLAGEPAQLEFSDFWKQVDLWLNEKGIFLEEIVETALTGEQVRTAATQGADLIQTVFDAIIDAIAWLITSVVFIVFVFLVSFYLLIDFAKLRGVTEVIMPDKYEPRFFDVLHKVDEAVGGFIRGQIIVATIVGILATIGLYFLGLKQYAVLIGIITGVGNLIPYLGPIMGAAPAVIYIFVSDTYSDIQERLIRLLILLGLFAFIQFIEGFILQPKVVGKSAQLHPVIVILALALGAPFGIMGMIIALPIAAATRVLLKEFYWDRREVEWHRTTGKERLDDVIVAGRPIRKGKLRKEGQHPRQLDESASEEVLEDKQEPDENKPE